MSVHTFKRKTRAELNRAKIADALEALASYVRTNALDAEPTGYCMVLVSDKGYEVQNLCVSKPEIKDCAGALDAFYRGPAKTWGDGAKRPPFKS